MSHITQEKGFSLLIICVFFIGAGFKSAEAENRSNFNVGGNRYRRQSWPVKNCRVDQAMCGSGNCIDQSNICDGKTDCNDRSDEQNCNIVNASQACSPGRIYCGHELDARYLPVKVIHSHKGLFRCGDDGQTVELVDICPWNCTSKGFDAVCTCKHNTNYCGHELAEFLGWDGYDNNTLYRCLDNELNLIVLTVKTCLITCKNGRCLEPCKETFIFCGHEIRRTIGFDGQDNTLYQCVKGKLPKYEKLCNQTCIEGKKDSYCSGTCGANETYCGHTLYEQGWRELNNDSLYLCTEDGANISTLSTCQSGCSFLGSYCPCIQDHIYCGYELYSMGWTHLKSKNQGAILGKCTNTLDEVKWLFTCDTCVINRENGSYCRCDVNKTYCGHELHKMGWQGYDNDTLYRCEVEDKLIDITTCSSNTCVQRDYQYSYCSCQPGNVYCGHELITRMNWWSWISYNTTLSQFQKLGRCLANKSIDWLSTCDTCVIDSERGSHCNNMCPTGKKYCGHELIRKIGRRYIDNILYQCVKGNLPFKIKTCRGDCINTISDSLCGGECAPWKRYCGSKLNQMGFNGYDNDSIYTCNNDGQSLNYTKRKDVSCARPCVPRQTYCGHDLQKKEHIADYNLEALYMCGNNDTFDSIAQCTQCISHENNSYCQCVHGWRYCGDWFIQNGHLGYNNNTVYLCTNNETVVLETCNPGECKGGAQFGHCLCTPGTKYCGHELFTHYEKKTFLFRNAIYRCSLDRRFIEQTTCNDTCTTNPPRCQEKCVVQRYYCGSHLQQLQGWLQTGLLSDWLYRCTNGTFAQAVQGCTAGCQVENNGDSYCKRVPPSWYWFFVGSVLLIVITSLVTLLARTIIKHRRLRKFISQHRIDVSQLVISEKLGSGQFGEIWRGNYKRNDGQIEVALKISKHHLDTEPHLGLASADCSFQEMIALDFLHHKNIIRAFGVCTNFKDRGGKTAPALVLEFMNGGSSIDYVRAERNRLSDEHLVRIILDVCRAGKHLSKMGVIHRDIGARNVLIQKNLQTGLPIVAKLTDFGLAKDIGKGTDLYKPTNPDRAMFHPRYTAPEGFGGCFSSKSDVWSFGVFIWEIYALMNEGVVEPMPYSEFKTEDIRNEIIAGYRLRRPGFASEDMYATMKACWSFKRESRPTFDQLLTTLESYRCKSFTTMSPEHECLILMLSNSEHTVTDGSAGPYSKFTLMTNNLTFS